MSSPGATELQDEYVSATLTREEGVHPRLGLTRGAPAHRPALHLGLLRRAWGAGQGGYNEDHEFYGYRAEI